MFQTGGTVAAAGELNKKLTETQRQLEAYVTLTLNIEYEF